jgi:hypothetical protein
MPKTPKKTAKTAAKKPVAKAKAQPKMKMKASMKPKADTKGSRRGFMWKALEQKQKKQKEQGIVTQLSVNPNDRVQTHATKHGFARFNGPRRRVG